MSMFGKLGTRISSAEHDEDIRPRERNFMILMIGRSSNGRSFIVAAVAVQYLFLRGTDNQID
jgi:hypothetical protein